MQLRTRTGPSEICGFLSRLSLSLSSFDLMSDERFHKRQTADAQDPFGFYPFKDVLFQLAQRQFAKLFIRIKTSRRKIRFEDNCFRWKFTKISFWHVKVLIGIKIIILNIFNDSLESEPQYLQNRQVPACIPQSYNIFVAKNNFYYKYLLSTIKFKLLISLQYAKI